MAPVQALPTLSPRSSPAASNPAIWVPILVIGVLIVFCLLVVVLRRTNWRQNLAFMSAGAAFSAQGTLPNASASTRELTAEELAGVNSNNTGRRSGNGNENGNNPAIAAPPTRRPRRTRRTPSQISTRSLPAYNKEAGEQELVVNVAPPESDSTSTVEMTQTADSQGVTYGTLPASLNTTPLLQDVQRGETPSYADATSEPPLNDAPSPEESPVVRPQRRSGIRGLFSLHRTSVSTPARQSVSDNTAHARSGSDTSRSHRSSQSASGSVLSLTPFRTISRQRSSHTLNSNHLSSPSVISLNSISLPIRETLLKNEFVYPSSGPTAEQMKLISSKESFSRFGKPYGPDAVAYAASRSRIEVMDPPPEFEDVGFDTGLPDSGPSDSSPTSPDDRRNSRASRHSAASSLQISDVSHDISPTSEPVVQTSEPGFDLSDNNAPPSSFRMPGNAQDGTAYLNRSESRASTMTGASFRTAQEGDDDVHMHVLEATDATVRPHTISPTSPTL